MIFKILQIAIFILLSFSSFALVDYSDSKDVSSTFSNKSQTNIGSQASKSSLIWKSDLSMDLNYELTELASDKMGVFNIGTHFQTPFNLFLDAKYWQANFKGKSLAGNPKFTLGFNWLRIGGPSDLAQLNLTAGVRLKSNSEIASSRTDKIFGIETTKKFGNFGIGLGYDVSLSDDPSRKTDLAIGTVHRIEVSSGWIVSNDIQFEISVENFRIVKSSSTESINKLSKDLSFSTLSPKMNLQIFENVNFELGARFRMQKAKSESDLVSAKLQDLNGAYSNSIYSGLMISI